MSPGGLCSCLRRTTNRHGRRSSGPSLSTLDSRPLLELRVLAGIDIAAHMEVIVIDVQNFDRFLVRSRIRDRPADMGDLGEVHRAFVMSMVQLSWADGRNESRRVDIVADLLFHDSHSAPLGFMQQREATFDGSSSFQSPHDFVIAGRI